MKLYIYGYMKQIRKLRNLKKEEQREIELIKLPHANRGGVKDLIKIDKNISLVDFKGFQYPYCNCLLIKDDINCLIDSSPEKKDLSYLMKQKIDLIINSHGHIDHYLYNYCFPNSKILMHQADQAMAQSADKYLETFGFKELVKDIKIHRLYLKAINYRSTVVDGNIEDNQIIRLGATNLEIVHLPGHSAGHCGFFFPDQGFIFISDIDLSTFGPWYANINCSLTEFFQSLDRLLKMKVNYIITGHGEGIVKEGVSRRLETYRDIIYARQKRIAYLLNRGYHTLDEITRQCPVYGQLPSPEQVFYLYEQVMILVHLRHLQELGYVFQENQYYYLKEGIHPSLI